MNKIKDKIRRKLKDIIYNYADKQLYKKYGEEANGMVVIVTSIFPPKYTVIQLAQKD